MIVNCLNISKLCEEDYKRLRESASEDRRKRAERFRYKEDAYRCIYAEALLRYSFREAGKEYDLEYIKRNKFGKMYLDNDFFFNLSHSGNWVVVAYGKYDVGVDIEKIRKSTNEIVEAAFSSEEKKHIDLYIGLEKMQEITRIWTMKESYIKFLGTGFYTDMKTFSVDTASGTIKDNNRMNDYKIVIKSELFEKNHFLSVCSEDEICDVRKISGMNL